VDLLLNDVFWVIGTEWSRLSVPDSVPISFIKSIHEKSPGTLWQIVLSLNLCLSTIGWILVASRKISL
jgi:hypothetical protein